MSDEQKIFSTRDLNLAATLVTLKFFNKSIDYQIEGNRGMPVGYFNFVQSKELDDTIQKYWRDELAVEPKAFTSTVRSLKAQITNVYKGPRVDTSKFKKSEEKDD